jgi:hypothetical protein
VTAVPTYRGLQDAVQFGERYVLGNQDTAPYERFDVFELNAQLVLQRGELGYAARDSARGSRGATRHGKRSSMRLIGCAGIRSSTCLRYA